MGILFGPTCWQNVWHCLGQDSWSSYKRFRNSRTDHTCRTWIEQVRQICQVVGTNTKYSNSGGPNVRHGFQSFWNLWCHIGKSQGGLTANVMLHFWVGFLVCTIIRSYLGRTYEPNVQNAQVGSKLDNPLPYLFLYLSVRIPMEFGPWTLDHWRTSSEVITGLSCVAQHQHLNLSARSHQHWSGTNKNPVHFLSPINEMNRPNGQQCLEKAKIVYDCSSHSAEFLCFDSYTVFLLRRFSIMILQMVFTHIIQA